MVGKGRGDRGSAQRDLLLKGESPELREKIEGFETVADDTPALPAAGAGRRPAPLQSPLWLNSNAILYRPFDSVR